MGTSVCLRKECWGDVMLRLEDVAKTVPPPESAPIYEDLVPAAERDRFPMLAGIDPYGDTCFNYLQSPLLAAELDMLEAEGLTDDRLSLVRALRVLIAEQMRKPHLYLWFVGD